MLAIAIPGLCVCAVLLSIAPTESVVTPLTGLLAACAILGSRISFDIEGTLFWDGSFLPMMCSAALLGPIPTALVTLLSELAVWHRERYAAKVLPLNLLGTLAPNIVAAWFLASIGTNVADGLFYGLLAVAVCGAVALNATLITVLAGILYDAPIVDRLRRHRAIVGPVAVNVVLALGAVAVYRGEGVVATAFVIGGVFVFAFVAGRLKAERDQQAEIGSLAESRGRLVAQILEAEDRERRVVAEAIHDDLLQTLAALRQDIAEGAAASTARELLDQAIRQSREIVRTTHPTVLDQVGLDAAVHTIAEQAAARGGLSIVVRIEREALGVFDRLLFTATRELLNNVVKHAEARHATVELQRVSDGIRLAVTDDGVGLEPNSRSSGLAEGHIGLWSLSDRADALGGRLRATSTASGTEVEIILPSRSGSSEPPAMTSLTSVGQDE